MSTITVIGSGYVGLVVAVGFAYMGRTVIGLDIDSEKIEKLNKGMPPFYESDIGKYLSRALAEGRLRFSTDMEYGIARADVIFLAVGTPAKGDGSADLSYIDQAVRDVARFARGYTVLITKSTVPVGTNRFLQSILTTAETESRVQIDVISNPEFLREGRAMEDFINPERIVLGFQSERARKVVEQLYGSTNLASVPHVWCNWETAELIKYAANSFLATKITFINQIANLSEVTGADIRTISMALGMDSRIGAGFLQPGPGYGGSCFPKDTRALLQTASDYEMDISLIDAVVSANEAQKERVSRKLEDLMGKLEGKRIAILGLTFKAETDDVRESASITLVRNLKSVGAIVQVHDPRGMENFRAYFPDILYFPSAMEALEDSHAMVLMTEWEEYRTLSLEEVRSVMNDQFILDTRNMLEASEALEAGFEYRSCGRGDLQRTEQAAN